MVAFFVFWFVRVAVEVHGKQVTYKKHSQLLVSDTSWGDSFSGSLLWHWFVVFALRLFSVFYSLHAKSLTVTQKSHNPPGNQY